MKYSSAASLLRPEPVVNCFVWLLVLALVLINYDCSFKIEIDEIPGKFGILFATIVDGIYSRIERRNETSSF